MKKIVFTGGGTAGHIMPNVAIIEDLNKYNKFQIFYLGSNGMEKEILKKYEYVKYIEIPCVKLARSLTFKNLLIPFKLIKSIQSAKKILKEISPDVIFSKGGYVSIPVCLAGNKLNIPIITHESDYTLGLANKIIARKAKYLCCSFKNTADGYGKNAIFTGSPIRFKILNGDGQIIRQRHNISSHLPIILIVGGSLGAQSINEIVWKNINNLTSKYIILHIVGKDKMNKTLERQRNYYQIEFAPDIENYFTISDIVISRAGSNTIFELLALKKPMILIPLPKSNGSRGDQELNAQYFEDNHFASVIKQSELNGDILNKTIEQILKTRTQFLSAMSKSTCNIANKKLIEIINSLI